ncbi:MAG: protein kinase [Verrucomicrobiales bacterium]|nr:protein kinase [Verrucomicrobiales bacterium]
MSERYQIKEKIGSGGVGVVYRAYDTKLHRDVAIKRVLLGTEQDNDDLTEKLLEEAKVLSTLNHPNIVTVHDVGVDNEGPFVVMELLKGETLDQIIERGVMPVEDFEIFARQTLEGLIAAQSVNVLHRDLKPPNIMITWLPSGNFQFKILDFGLAKFARAPSTQTVAQGHSILGSIFFMAPEQFEQLPLDGRTDLYSLGALFYYALTAQHPFQGDMAAQVMAAHMMHQFVPLRLLRPDVPDEISEWVEGLMAREMDDRPADARAALEGLNPPKVIDEKQFREVTGNDPVTAGELIDEFSAESDQLLEKLIRELESGQGLVAKETAESIRGTAATLGFTEITKLAKIIEVYAGSDADHCRNIAGKFPGATDRIRETVAGIKWR